MPDKITASWERLSEDAFYQSERNFHKAIDVIDKKFGNGYAKSHPELISSFMQSSAIEYSGTSITSSIQSLREDFESISDALGDIASQIVDLKE